MRKKKEKDNAEAQSLCRKRKEKKKQIPRSGRDDRREVVGTAWRGKPYKELRNFENLATTSPGKRKNQEVAFAGDDDAEEAAVGRKGKFAETEPVKNGNGRGLRDGNVFVGCDGGEGRNRKPDDVAGFFFDGALEENA